MDVLVTHFAEILFYVIAALCVIGGVGVVALRNPVHAALSLLWTFLMVAVLFVLRHAEFLAAVQVLVYAGGIMVLFLFVIMLVNVRRMDPERVFLSRLGPVAVLAGVLFGALVAAGILFGVVGVPGGGIGALTTPDATVLGVSDPSALPVGNTEAVGTVLYTTYLVPFEIVSVVLLVAMIGAIVFGRKDAALEGTGGRMEQ